MALGVPSSSAVDGALPWTSPGAALDAVFRTVPGPSPGSIRTCSIPVVGGAWCGLGAIVDLVGPPVRSPPATTRPAGTADTNASPKGRE